MEDSQGVPAGCVGWISTSVNPTAPQQGAVVGLGEGTGEALGLP